MSFVFFFFSAEQIRPVSAFEKKHRASRILYGLVMVRCRSKSFGSEAGGKKLSESRTARGGGRPGRRAGGGVLVDLLLFSRRSL